MRENILRCSCLLGCSVCCTVCCSVCCGGVLSRACCHVCCSAHESTFVYSQYGVFPFVSSRLFSFLLDTSVERRRLGSPARKGKRQVRGKRREIKSITTQRSSMQSRYEEKRRDEEMRRDDMRERKGWTCITNICLHLLPSSIRCTVTRKQGAMRYVHSQVVCCVRGPGFRRGARRQGQRRGQRRGRTTTQPQ